MLLGRGAVLMPILELESHQSRPDVTMTQDLHKRLLDAGITVPDECVRFDIVADVGEIVTITWRCHATRSLLAALGEGE